MDHSKLAVMQCFVEDVEALWSEHAFAFSCHATVEVHVLGSIGGGGVVGDDVSVWLGGWRKRVFSVFGFTKNMQQPVAMMSACRFVG